MSGSNEWGRPPDQYPGQQHPGQQYPGQQHPTADPFVAPSNPGFGAHPVPPSGSSPQAPWPTGAPAPLIPQRDAPTGGAVAALILAILGALVGLAVGWGFPLSLVALVLALTSRRANRGSRRFAVWSVVLVIVSGLASMGWAIYSVLYLLG